MSSPVVTGTKPGSHELLVYRDQRRRDEIVAAWVQGGLEDGDRVLYSDLSDGALLNASLAGRGVDVAAATDAGRLGVLPFQELHPDSGNAVRAASALVDGSAGVRLLGHATAALTRTSDVDWRRIEQVMDHLCRTLDMCVLCQYDARHTSGPRLDWAVGLHPDAIRGDAMELRPRGARLYLTGELDVGFAEPLMLGLRLACARQPGPSLMMDLSGLTFLDVVGARAVLLGTREFRKAGGLVSLLDPQPSVRRLLSLLRIEEQDRVLVA